MDKITETIGLPAVLEQCAEECTELAQACLKLARYYRRENPTRASFDKLRCDFNEELGDVSVCVQLLVDAGLGSYDAVDSTMMSKRDRWLKSLYLKKEE